MPMGNTHYICTLYYYVISFKKTITQFSFREDMIDLFLFLLRLISEFLSCCLTLL